MQVIDITLYLIYNSALFYHQQTFLYYFTPTLFASASSSG